jgi:hypothetical protein
MPPATSILYDPTPPDTKYRKFHSKKTLYNLSPSTITLPETFSDAYNYSLLSSVYDNSLISS